MEALVAAHSECDTAARLLAPHTLLEGGPRYFTSCGLFANQPC